MSEQQLKYQERQNEHNAVSMLLHFLSSEAQNQQLGDIMEGGSQLEEQVNHVDSFMQTQPQIQNIQSQSGLQLESTFNYQNVVIATEVFCQYLQNSKDRIYPQNMRDGSYSHQKQRSSVMKKSSKKPVLKKQRILKRVKARNNEEPQQSYHTKNLLPAVKPIYLKYLVKMFPKQDLYEKYSFLKRIRDQDGISKDDYNMIHQNQYFHQALKKMFKNRVLYRQLMNSRSNQKNKINYIKMLYVFERAFNEQMFKSIN